jgi:thiamine biosynthesis lipoprotein ApbE
MPRRPDVTDALTKVGYRRVFVDPDGRTGRFTQPGIELDPGEIGKGYAVDRIVDVLKRERDRVQSRRIVPNACGTWNEVWPVGRHA